MKLFFSELRYLNELYQRLEVELTAGRPGEGPPDAAALADSVLRNRDLLQRIEQMNSRLTQLADEWEHFKHCIEEPLKSDIQNLARTVAARGSELYAASALALDRLESRLNSLREELGEISRGTRFLESVRPVRTNYPKFVDSIG